MFSKDVGRNGYSDNETDSLYASDGEYYGDTNDQKLYEILKAKYGENHPWILSQYQNNLNEMEKSFFENQLENENIDVSISFSNEGKDENKEKENKLFSIPNKQG